MDLPQLEQCVCGCSLETGSKIIGFFQLVMCAVSYIAFSSIIHELSNTSESKTESTLLTITSIVVTIVVFALFIFTILMLVGVYKKRPSFMFPWIVLDGIVICLSLIVAPIYYIIILSGSEPEGIILDIILNIISFCIGFYLFLVVHSHYNNLK